MNQLPAALARSDAAECPIPLYNAETDHLIRWSKSGGDTPFRGDWSLINIPSDRQKAILSERRRAIGSVMTFNKAKVAKAIAEMLKCYFANIPKDRKEFELLVTKFVSELSDIPTWAVELGCMKIRMGQVQDVSSDFPPTTIRVRNVCLPPVNQLRDEADAIHKILMSRKTITYVESEETRAKIKEGMANLANELRAKSDDALAENVARANVAYDTRDRMILEEYRREGVEPVYSTFGLVAPSTLKSIGKWPKQAA